VQTKYNDDPARSSVAVSFLAVTVAGGAADIAIDRIISQTISSSSRYFIAAVARAHHGTCSHDDRVLRATCVASTDASLLLWYMKSGTLLRITS
jgi:hypothetical protein